MRKIFTLLFFLLALSGLAQKNLKEAITFEKPPVIDGQVADWPGEWWVDPDGKFFCNVGNDADNLYIRLKVGDDVTQQKIGLFGLSVKLNPSGKKKGKVGLKYPVGKDKSEFKKNEPQAVDKSNDAATLLQMKKDLISDVEVVELIGLAKENIVSSRLGLANGIEAIIVAQDDGAYIYEAKIPFKAFRIKKSDVEVLGVEFQTGRFNPQAKAPMSQGTGPAYGGPAYGGAGYGGAGYGGAGYRQPRVFYNNYSYNALSTPGYLFVPVKLK